MDKKMVLYLLTEIEAHLRNSDMRPVYPKITWNAPPIIIAPCRCFIMCLKFCNQMQAVKLSQDCQRTKTKRTMHDCNIGHVISTETP